MSSTNRISERIKQDHRDLESLYDKMLNTKDADDLTRLQNKFTWELARHSVGEELVVYPAFEKYMRDGKEAADKDRKEHKTVLLPFPSFCLFLFSKKETR